ncbi:hypothetical protein FGIG_08904 [Fasciola gigantica]|uniref:Uncharacterized protein n=1 Tax=Fasciola gigantica TaxID=46835 RepID=A0A504YPW4_FASGI|nr:hypothetical protein FGIG_08904 [Fasciola gigantica]
MSSYSPLVLTSPKENECDSREEKFMEYLHALRAAYPDHKDRQLAKLMENTKPVQNRLHTQQSPGGKTETNPKMVVDLQGSTEKLRNVNMNTFMFAPVVRCTARGSDPQLRGSRFAPCGPNRELALGPDPTVHRGPDPRLLTQRSIDTPPWTNTVSSSDFGLFKSVICSSLV